MPIKLGNTNITDIRKGTTKVYQVAKGNDVVWKRGLDTQRVTVGNWTSHGAQAYGYNPSLSAVSAVEDGHSLLFDADIGVISLDTFYSPNRLHVQVYKFIPSAQLTTAFSKVIVNGTEYSMANDLNFANSSSYFYDSSSWHFNSSTNPFGTTSGAKVWVEFQ